MAQADLAHAQQFSRSVSNLTGAIQNTLDLRPSDVTNLRLGLGPGIAPAFEGSREYRVNPVPLISLRYRDVVRVDNNEVDFTAFDHVFDLGGGDDQPEKLSIGPTINLDFGRSEKDAHALRGLGNVGFSFEVGGDVTYMAGDTKIELEATQDVADGHGGGTADLTVARTLYRGTKFAFGGSAVLTMATSKYLKSFFGIDARQAIASGLPEFHPKGGLKDAMASVHGDYSLSTHWSVLGVLTYERMLGDAAASPLVKLRGDANQLIGSIFVAYAF
jgi:outer membrane protein